MGEKDQIKTMIGLNLYFLCGLTSIPYFLKTRKSNRSDFYLNNILLSEYQRIVPLSKPESLMSVVHHQRFCTAECLSAAFLKTFFFLRKIHLQKEQNLPMYRYQAQESFQNSGTQALSSAKPLMIYDTHE